MNYLSPCLHEVVIPMVIVFGCTRNPLQRQNVDVIRGALLHSCNSSMVLFVLPVCNHRGKPKQSGCLKLYDSSGVVDPETVWCVIRSGIDLDEQPPCGVESFGSDPSEQAMRLLLQIAG